MKQILLAAIAVICFLAGCNNSKQVVTSKKAVVDPSELNGAWQLDYISGSATAFDALYPDKKPQLIFDIAASRISGNTGCNSFSGPVSVEGSKINFNQPLALTKMFCPGGGETAFLEALKKITSWAVTDASTLNLIAGDVAALRFTKVK
jgi:heat shock protein HslJ